MRMTMTLLALTGWAGLACGQQSTQPARAADPLAAKNETKKSALELAIEEALKNNPDLKVAAAKLAEAEASLGAARAQVVRKMVAGHMSLEVARGLADSRERELQRAKALVEKGSMSSAEFDAIKSQLAQAKAALAAVEADLEYLAGKSKQTAVARGMPLAYTIDAYLAERWAGRPTAAPAEASRKGPAPEGLRAALEKKVTLDLDEVSAGDALSFIKKQTGVHIQASPTDAAWKTTLTAKLTDVPVSAVLQLLEDALGNHRVVVREYGLLIAPTDKVPGGALTLAEFLASKPRPAQGTADPTPAQKK